MDWSKYKDEIIELGKTQGSPSIFQHLKDNYPDEDWPRSGERKIRKILSREARNNTFDDVLEGGKFDPHNNWSYGWLKTKDASIFIKNQNGEDRIPFEELREDFISEMKSYSPSFKKIKRGKINDPHCLVLDIADLHIGKYASESETGEEYNSDIAIQRALDGVAGILEKTSGFPFDQIVFVIGNDVLHVDTPKNTTTKGTHQDVDGMWYENYVRARKLYIGIIESLLEIADVHVVHSPSNHDYVTGFMLADSVASFFSKCKNITFDVSMAHRKYYKYGSNLMGFSHGDGSKMEQLPMLMANESKKLWSETDFRYIYLHHIHHKDQVKFRSGKDYHGVTVEYLRSPSAADSWHAKMGFQHAPKGIEAFVHHKEFGQVSRISHLFK